MLLLVLGTAFWGISFPVTKLAVGNTSSSTFLFYRFLLATVVLAALFYRHLALINTKTLKASAGLAIPLLFGINFQTLGVKLISAPQCAFIAGTCVVIIPVLKLLFYRQKIDGRIWLAAVVAMVGLAIVSLKENLTVGLGDLYTFIGSVGFAVYLIKVERYARTQDIKTTIIPMFAICAIVSLCVALVDSKAQWIPKDNSFWVGIGYCALFSTVYMYSVFNIAQKYISAERVSIIYLFEPVFAALAAYFILNEGLTLRLLAGGSLILLGTLIAEIKAVSLRK